MRSLPTRRRGGLGRRRVPPLLGAALAFVVAIAPVPATAGDAVSTVTGIVAGAASGDVTSDTGRFVALWDARFRSGEAFQAYLDSDQEYDDGYNDRTPEEQAVLVRALVDYWRATDAGFAEYVDWTADPDAETAEAGARPNADQILMTVDAIVFHKEAFKAALREDEGGAGDPAATAEPAADTSAADPLGEQAAAALAAALDAAAVAALDRLADQPAQVLEPLADQVATVPPADVLDRLPTSGTLGGVDFDLASDLLDAVLAPVPQVTPPSRPDPALNTSFDLDPQNLVYGVCWQLPATTEQCTGMTYVAGILTQLPGQAAGIDVDGNLTTGQLGTDLEIGLVVDPLSTPGGVGVAVTVKRYGTAATNAKGVVRYALPGSDKEVRVGFNGIASTLQTEQRAAVTFEDVAQMSSGDVKVKAAVSHAGTPGSPTVRLVTDFVSTATADALAGTTTITRAPGTHTVRLLLKRAAGSALVRVESTHASSTLPDIQVSATARLGAAQLGGYVTMAGVPASTVVTAVTTDSTNKTDVTYDASSQLTRLQAAVNVVPDVAAPGNRYTAALDVDRLPIRMTLALQHAQVAYNASSAIGSGAGNAIDATVEEYRANTLERRAYVALSSVPTTVTLVRTPSVQRYVVDSPAPIASAVATYYDRPSRLAASVVVSGFPGHAELTMPTAADPRIAWTASAPTSGVTVTGTFGVWSAGLTVTNVPTSMAFVPGTGGLDISAANGAAATVTAYLTNTGVYAVGLAGENYATLVTKKLSTPRTVPGGTISTEVAAALQITGITKVKVTPGAATTYQIKAGGGAPLYLLVRLEDVPANRRGYATARIVNFPGEVNGTIGEATTFFASSSADLSAYAEYGPLATHAAMPSVHGVQVRREVVGGVVTTRGQVWLTGLPTLVTIAPGNVYLGGLRPSQSSLTVDIRLLDNAAAPVTAYASLTGIPTGTPHTITVSWSTEQITGGYRTKVDATTSGATFGALTVNVEYARYKATLTTSALPRTMAATITEVEGQTTIGWTAYAPIASVTAGMLARAVPTASWTARAAVTLTDLPSSFTLTTGRDGSGSGPVLSYTANASTLDAEVTADGSLKTSNASLAASLYFKLVNLASSVSVTKSGAGFALGGTGRTARVEARVSARASYSKSDSGTANAASWVKFPWSYSFQVDPIVRNLAVTLTDVRSFAVDAGLVSRLSGDYGMFDLRWDSFTVNVKAQGSLRAQLNLWVCNCSFTIVSASLVSSVVVNPAVRLYEDGWHDIFSVHVNFWCAYLDFGVRIRPRPIGTTSLQGGITLYGTPGYTKTNWATPVVFGWTKLSDVVTGLSVYGTSFVQGWFHAKWTCW